MRDQAGEKGETEEARAETGTGKAAVRQNREEKERKTQRLSSEMLKRKRTKDKRKSGVDPRGEIQKGSTSGTAVGAKLGRTKGNEQKAEYENLERRHEKSGWSER